MESVGMCSFFFHYQRGPLYTWTSQSTGPHRQLQTSIKTQKQMTKLTESRGFVLYQMLTLTNIDEEIVICSMNVT